MHSSLLSIPLLAAAVMAQQKMTVQVGADGKLAFSPNAITAPVGTEITFEFNPKNHSVAQSSFAAPCVPLAGGKGIFSGFFPTTSGVNSKDFTITVADTTPIWLYCAQGDHCESGMVAAINAPSTGNTLAAFTAAAAKVNKTIIPTEVQGGTVGDLASGSSGSSSSVAASSSAAATSAASYAGKSSTAAASMASYAATAGSSAAAASASASAAGSDAGSAASASATADSGSASSTGSAASSPTSSDQKAGASQVAVGLGSVLGAVAALAFAL